MRRVLFSFICLTLVLLGQSNPATAKRVALVIGNSAYEHAAPLRNPRNDAKAVSTILKKLGFDVITGIDLNRSQLESKVRDFARAIRGADTSLFFYAGHGLQVNGSNYLAPVDAKLGDEADLTFETVRLEDVLAQMEREPRTNLVFLDACRDNPLARNLARSMGTRSTAIGRGLARIETGIGTLIAFATQPGNVALDGDGQNSPFTTALLKHIETPGLDVAQLMRRVRVDVIGATSNRQVPWSNSSLTGDFFFASRAVPVEPTKPGQSNDAVVALQKRLKELEERLRKQADKPKDEPKVAVGTYPEQPKVDTEPETTGLRGLSIAALSDALRARFKIHGNAKGVVVTEVDPQSSAAQKNIKAGEVIVEVNQSEMTKPFDVREQVDTVKKSGRRSVLLLVDDGKGDLRFVAMPVDGGGRIKKPADKSQDESKVAVGTYPDKPKAAPSRAYKPGDEFQECDACPKMVVVPAGQFMMGSPKSEPGRDKDEGPQHKVTISKAFAVGKFEVTKAQFEAFVKETGHDTGNQCWVLIDENWKKHTGRSWRNPGFLQGGDHPVTCVNWGDSKSYVAWLSSKIGKEYRLLSEAEWEYAARAGTTTPFSTGRRITADQANFNGNDTYNGSRSGRFREKTVSVGSFAENAFGLHDMHGNVWEWVEDCPKGNYFGALTDGSPRKTGDCSKRVLRGGSWDSFPSFLRSADRDWFVTVNRVYSLGLRVARTLTPSELGR